ncbi:hypothetical protein ScPMuIL_001724 [Solemya velum]
MSAPVSIQRRKSHSNLKWFIPFSLVTVLGFAVLRFTVSGNIREIHIIRPNFPHTEQSPPVVERHVDQKRHRNPIPNEGNRVRHSGGIELNNNTPNQRPGKVENGNIKS